MSKTLVWDRESAIGGKGKVTQLAAAFAGTLATRVVLAPPADPEFKGMTERNMNRPDFRSVLQARMELDEQEVFAGDA